MNVLFSYCLRITRPEQANSIHKQYETNNTNENKINTTASYPHRFNLTRKTDADAQEC